MGTSRNRNTYDRRPPSRVRYEESHPTVSCRVPKALYDKLNAIRHAGDRSFADILKVGLRLLEPKVMSAADARKEGHTEGYTEGYAAAVAKFRVTFPCNVCGEPIEVTREED